jgi:acyl-CoA synthetase (NDP forming)
LRANCVGYSNLQNRVGTYFAPISPTLRKGGVSAVAQSGSIILPSANGNRGIGFNFLISNGNERVMDLSDYLENQRLKNILDSGFHRSDGFLKPSGIQN